MHVNRLNRVEMIVPKQQFQTVIDTYSNLLGVSFQTPEFLEPFDLLTTVSWSAGLEITCPNSQKSPLFHALNTRGSYGVLGPIVWEVDDIEKMKAHVKKLGITIAFEGEFDGNRQFTLLPSECFGYSLTFTDKAPEKAASPAALVSGINRIELMMPPENIPQAREFFNKLLGAEIPPEEHMTDHNVISTVCWRTGVELVGPADPGSPLNALFEQQGKFGANGPIVWEVPSVDAIKEAATEQGHTVMYEFESHGRRQVSLGKDSLFGYVATFSQQL